MFNAAEFSHDAKNNTQADTDRADAAKSVSHVTAIIDPVELFATR